MGLRASGPVSRILMDHWAREIKRICTRTMELASTNPVKYEGMDILTLKKYVDDCLAATRKLRKGVRWCQEEQALIWTPEMEQEDAGISNEVVTMKALWSKASGVINCLNFTYDCPDLNSSEGMSVLDTTICVGQ